MSIDLALIHALAILFCLVAALFVVLIVLAGALAAHAWANAIAAAHRAHAHGLQVKAAEVTQREAEEALENTQPLPPRADYTPPTDDELRESVRAARRDRDYPTTTENDGATLEPPIRPGGYFAEGSA